MLRRRMRGAKWSMSTYGGNWLSSVEFSCPFFFFFPSARNLYPIPSICVSNRTFFLISSVSGGKWWGGGGIFRIVPPPPFCVWHERPRDLTTMKGPSCSHFPENLFTVTIIYFSIPIRRIGGKKEEAVNKSFVGCPNPSSFFLCCW
jgi:hypothetical protein